MYKSTLGPKNGVNADYKNYGDEYKDGEVCDGVSWCPELEKPENIIGIQGCLWSETMRNPEMLLSQLFPRMIALADRAHNSRDWDESQSSGLSILQDPKFVSDWSQFKITFLETIDKMKQISPDFPIRLPLVGSKQTGQVSQKIHFTTILGCHASAPNVTEF